MLRESAEVVWWFYLGILKGVCHNQLDRFDGSDQLSQDMKSNCRWIWWDVKKNETRNRILRSVKAMRQMGGLGDLSILKKLDRGIWRGMSDLLYVPKKVFPIYVAFVAQPVSALFSAGEIRTREKG